MKIIGKEKCRQKQTERKKYRTRKRKKSIERQKIRKTCNRKWKKCKRK